MTFASSKVNNDPYPVVLMSPITPVHWIGLCTLAINQWLAELLRDSFVAFWLAQILVWMQSGLALLRTWLLTRYRGWKRSSILTKHQFGQFPPMNMPTSNRNTGSWEPVFSSSQSQAAHFDLGNIVDTKISRLKSDSELETARFRQSVYNFFCKNKSIPTRPLWQSGWYERIIACFIKQLMLDHNSRSATLGKFKRTVKTVRQLHCHLTTTTPRFVLFVQHCKWYSGRDV